MKAKILNVNSISDEKNKRYWEKYIGDVFRVVSVISYDKYGKQYELDMKEEEGKIMFWYDYEIEIIEKGKYEKRKKENE